MKKQIKLEQIDPSSEIYRYNRSVFNLMSCIEDGKAVPIFENGYLGVAFLNK